MEDFLQRIKQAFAGENGAPNIGMVVAAFIGVCVALYLGWQLVGPTGADQTSAQMGQQGGATGSGGEPGAQQVEGGPLTDEDRRAVEKTAEKLGMAAYGYTGSDPKEYEAGVEKLVTPAFWDSDGGIDVSESEAMVEDGGPASTWDAHVTSEVRAFEITEEAESVVGTLYMIQHAYPLRELVYAERELELVPNPDGDGWKVSYAGEWTESSDSPEEVELAEYEGKELPRDQRDAMKEATEQYVQAVYSYTGTDVDDYRAGVREAVTGPEFFESPGAERVASEIETIETDADAGYTDTYAEDLRLESLLPREKLKGGEIEAVFFSNTQGATDAPWAELIRLTEEDGSWKVAYSGSVIEQLSSDQEEAVDALVNDQESQDLFEEEKEIEEGGSPEPSSNGEEEQTVGGTTVDTTTQTATEAAGDASEQAVEEATRDYYEAVDRQDWAYTWESLDSGTRDLFSGQEEWREKNQNDADTNPLELDTMDVEVSMSGDEEAEVSVYRSFEDGTTLERTTEFVLEDGSWKHRFTDEEIEMFEPGVPLEEG